MASTNAASTTGATHRNWSSIFGLIIGAIVILFLLMDGAMKLIPLQPVIEATAQLGWPVDVATLRLIGTLLLVSTLLYAWPQTAMLGAILITGYLGGAIATHVRIGSPLFSHSLFGVYLGVMTWGGLWLRDPVLRDRLPWRKWTQGGNTPARPHFDAQTKEREHDLH